MEPRHGFGSVWQRAELGLQYVVGVQESVSLWGKAGRPPKLLRRSKHYRPVSARELVLELGEKALRRVSWREGSQKRLASRLVAARVRPAHRDYWRAEPHEELWLLAEWPKGAAEPMKYWLSNLAPETVLKDLVRLAKHRCIVERDYLELKQELGLWGISRFDRGADFTTMRRSRLRRMGFWWPRGAVFPSTRAGKLELAGVDLPEDYRPRVSPEARAAV